mgnify:CR=1 FL=1
MTLGMISWIREEDFQRVKAKGLSFVELDVNDRVKEFLDALEPVSYTHLTLPTNREV